MKGLMLFLLFECIGKYNELIKLKKILDDGIITEEQFKEIKKDLIQKSMQVN